MPKQSHRTIWIMLIIFTVPMLLAFYFYHRGVPMGSVNRGHLLRPPEAILKDKIWDGKWSLVYLHPTRCAEHCQQRVHDLHQVRIATGKYQNHVQVALINFIPLATTEVNALRRQAPQATLASVSQNEILKRLPAQAAKDFDQNKGAFFIVDPHGLFMMSYAPQVKGEDIYHDLKRLLRVN